MFQYRSPISVILLSIVTCGFYAIFFQVTTQDAIRNNYTKENLPSGLSVFLLSIITCGIYGIYWIYKTSVIINELLQDVGAIPPDDVAINTFIGILFTQIGFFAIIQSKINQIISIRGNNGY
ncbi:MAG: DUF4234 domain-containing protein [Bacilli bacterium]